MTSTRRTYLITAVTAATLAGLALGAGPALAGPSGSVAAAPTGSPALRPAVVPTAVWQILGSGGLSSIDQPAVLRNGATLTALWHREDAPNSESVRSRLISGSGVAGAGGAVVTGWSGIVADPVLARTSGGVVAIFGGIRTTNPSEDFSGQLAGAHQAGAGWSFDNASYSRSTNGYASYGTAATTYAGTSVQALALNETISVHQGSDSSFPATAPDTQVTEPVGTSTYYTALATRPSDGSVWMSWYDINSSTPAYNGIRVMQLLPTPSAIVGAPLSHDASGNSENPDQRVAMAAVPTGPWIAYATGYPSATAIRLYNPAAHVLRTVPLSAGADHVAIAAGPGGRLWIAWNVRYSRVIRFTRTNAAVTAFEPVQSLAALDTPNAIALDGTLGPLDLVVNSSSRPGVTNDVIAYRRALPALTVTAGYRKGKVTLTVSDAGLRQYRAAVRFGKKTYYTSSKGVVVVAVGTKKGIRSLTVAKTGYVAATVRVRVR